MGLLVVFFGGGLGACLRYLFSLWAGKKFGITYWATFWINVLGCAFLGFISALAVKHSNLFNDSTILFLTTGVAGGFTTFSTFSGENINLLKNGETLKCIIYTASSLFFGLLSVCLGFWATNYF